MMTSKFYKCCAVPLCENTTITTPNKLFISVPQDQNIRKKWLQLARRDRTTYTSHKLYFCEDHFDLPNDMENYMEYHIMGYVTQIRTKPGCLPSKFDCQPDRLKRMSMPRERPYIVKKQKMMTVEECLNTPSCSSQESTKPVAVQGISSDISAEFPIIEDTHETADKSVQALITYKYRSKAVQVNTSLVNKAVSPIKPTATHVSTSPFKVDNYVKSRLNIRTDAGETSRKILQENSDSDYTPSITCKESSPSILSSQTLTTSDCSEFLEDANKLDAISTLQNTIKKIESNPRFYIGITKSCYYIVEIIESEIKVKKHIILLCLKKIRLDNKFKELADDFCMTPANASKVFLKTIPKIASIMHPFVVNLDPQRITKTLPMSFRHKYYEVSCIIDCLEIEIQKPSNAVNQALTWSDYKKSNTLKYLISCTPNGLVNYISPGFGGRATDTCIVESCDFIKTLERGMCVMADRGFKHVQKYLEKAGVQLVRPISVQTGIKMTKKEAKETKQIASLRIHVERVIRRLREFSMLKPHACVNINFVKVFDDIIIIACGLINLQDSLIKQ